MHHVGAIVYCRYYGLPVDDYLDGWLFLTIKAHFQSIYATADDAECAFSF